MKTLSLVLILLILPVQVFGATTEEMNQQIASLLRELIALLQEKISFLQKQLNNIQTAQPPVVVFPAAPEASQEPPYFVAEFLPNDSNGDPAVFTIRTRLSNGQLLANQLFTLSTTFNDPATLYMSDVQGIIKFRAMQRRCPAEGVPTYGSVVISSGERSYSNEIICIPPPRPPVCNGCATP